MLTVVFAVLVIAACGIIIAGTVMFLDLTFGEGRKVVAEEERTERMWRPPFLSGDELRGWARSVSRHVTSRKLEGVPDRQTVGEINRSLSRGLERAMLPIVPGRKLRGTVSCPAEGQGVIGVTAVEAIQLAEYVRRTQPVDEVRRLRAVSRENAVWVGKRLLGFGNGSPCALQGRDCVCIAYDDRPFACRPYHAYVQLRNMGLDDRGNGSGVSPWPDHMRLVREGLNLGVSEALDEAGMDGAVYELHSALAAALEAVDPSAAWARGEDLFAGCNRLEGPYADTVEA